MHRIFAYGTLKKGMPNHGLIEDEQNGKSQFISIGKTVTKYPMVVDPDFGIPFLLDSPGKGKNVEGEIWDVDDQLLKKLDGLEMHPDWYTRHEDEISVPESVDGKNVFKCWVYRLSDFHPKMASYECISSYYTPSNYVSPSERLKDFDPWSFKKS